MYIPNCHSMRNSMGDREFMAVQTSITEELPLSHHEISKFTEWTKMNNVYTCHVQSVSCVYNVQLCMYAVHTVLNSMKYVQTCTWHVQTCIYIDINVFSCIFMYIHGQTMYIACACRPCTISCVCEHENQKVKICYVLGSNPLPCACQMVALNHCTTRLDEL